MSTAPTPSRGEVWLADFDPAVGAEIQKVRPALVISLDSIGRLPLRMVVPLTDWKP
jgi:mRNA interferase MazF